MKITGEYRTDEQFKLVTKPTRVTTAYFIAVLPDRLYVTRRCADILEFPEGTQVLANWHGQWSTDVFLTTVGKLRELAATWVD